MLYPQGKELKRLYHLPKREGFTYRFKERGNFWDYVDRKKCRYHFTPTYYKYMRRVLRSSIGLDWGSVKNRMLFNIRIKFNGYNPYHLMNEIRDVETFNIHEHSGCGNPNRVYYYVDENNKLAIVTNKSIRAANVPPTNYSSWNKVPSRPRQKPLDMKVFDYVTGETIERRNGIHYIVIMDECPYYWHKEIGSYVNREWRQYHKTKQLNKKELRKYQLKND